MSAVLRTGLWPFAAGIAAAVLLSAPVSAADAAPPAAALVKGNTAFAVAVYGELGKADGNVFFSPFSVSTALGMAFAGAREDTARQMQDVLGLPSDQAPVPSGLSALGRDISAAADSAGEHFMIANGLCLTRSRGVVSDEYKALLRSHFDAELFEGGLEQINSWVRDKTDGKIEKILDELDRLSVCVLLNAAYFRGTWASPFDPDQTRAAPFSIAPGRTATVPFMSQNTSLPIIEQPGLRIAALPYEGGRLALVIVLPDDVGGLAAIERNLTAARVQEWLGELTRAPQPALQITIPKFVLRGEYDLIPPCRSLGMRDAFQADRANFSGIDGGANSLYVSQARHRAFVELDERGTEAAAATAIELSLKGAPPRPVRPFRADHPFLFMIVDRPTGSVLFMGRLVDPSAG